MTNTDPRSLARVRAVAMLAERPLPLDELTRRLDLEGLLAYLREDGVSEDDLIDAVEEELIDTDAIWTTPDDELVASTAALLEGVVLTHRLRAEELDDEAVEMVPDLEILDWDLHRGLELEGGGRVVDVPFDESTSAFAGPAGWLRSFEAGDCVAFTRRGHQVRVDKVDVLGDGERELEALGRYVDHRIPEHHGEEAVPVLMDALVADPAAFRAPAPPVAELLERLGFERRGFSFGRRSEKWKTISERMWARERTEVARAWRFDHCCRRAFDVVNAAFDAAGPDGTDVDGTDEVAAALLHGAVAPAFVQIELSRNACFRSRVARFADTVVAGSRRTAGARWVAAAAADASGDVAVAEGHLRDALRSDPGYSPVAVSLAGYETDRGDLARAITLLQHPELSSTPTLEFLMAERERRTSRFRGVGRNDPCPCGSGRKFKVCCQRRTDAPLAERISLFQHKLAAFAGRPQHRSRIAGIASLACDRDDPDFTEQVAELCDDPLIRDFALWEGGIAAEYLEHRGGLLPADERDLLAALLDEPRRLWELDEVDPGVGMTMRDSSTGERRRVREVSGSLGHSPGEYMLARVADLAGAAELIGVPLEVPLNLRASTLELVDHAPDAEALAAWYRRATAMPIMRNREGEVMVLCRGEIRGPEGSGLTTDGLDALFERDGEQGRWIELFSLPDGERILRGTVSRKGDALIVEANSVERFERLMAAVVEAVPGAVVVDEEHTPARVALANARRSADPSVRDDILGQAQLPPEMVAAVEAYIRQKEQSWCDESIPALGGLTPRQALDDPTRREDLEALLRDMEHAQSAGPGQGFDGRRIRSLLGL
ncbi:MAG: hypothetical protein NVS3B12_31130 [Acidimicrobiales bacterium]